MTELRSVSGLVMCLLASIRVRWLHLFVLFANLPSVVNFVHFFLVSFSLINFSSFFVRYLLLLVDFFCSFSMPIFHLKQ